MLRNTVVPGTSHERACTSDRWIHQSGSRSPTTALPGRHDPDRGSGSEVAVRRGEPPRVVRRSFAEARTDGARRLRGHRYDSEVPRMNRQNLFSDEWDGQDEEAGTRQRIFW